MEFNIEEGFSTLVFDMDGTLYQCSEYIDEGTRNEIRCVAKHFGWTEEEAKQQVAVRRKELSIGGVRATMSQTIYSFGFTLDWWNRIRTEQCYHPERFLTPDTDVRQALLGIRGHYRMVIGTNSPGYIGQRVVQCIGLADIFLAGSIYGPGEVQHSKPAPGFYAGIASAIGVDPGKCLSIGDREEADGIPARSAGMRAVIINGKNELLSVIEALKHRAVPRPGKRIYG